MASCAAKKEAAEFKLQPEWMKQKPIIHGYYVGIGSAKKVGTSAEYIAKARQDALADLAGEVSATISSTSVLHTIETEYGHSETFDQKIETTTDDYLEGFEPAEAYETPDSYWVYFHISREIYHEMKEKKKKEATETALAKYISGKNDQEQNHPVEALSFYLQGLQALVSYLDEETPADFKGNKIDIGNELYSSINEIISALSIQPETPTITVKRGESVNPPLRFKTLFNALPVQGIPVELGFSGGYLKKDREISDQYGFINLYSDPIYSLNCAEQIHATINLKDIAMKAVDDLFIRGLVNKKYIDPAITIVKIIQPALALKIDKQSGTLFDDEKIINLFSEVVLASGYLIQPESSADFIFGIKYSFRNGQSSGGLTSVYLDGEMNIYDKNSKLIWAKKTEEIKGVSTDLSSAKNKAFDEFILSLGRKYLQQGIDEIK
jgi:hypothetical protein